jgi:hypothetical protein
VRSRGYLSDLQGTIGADPIHRARLGQVRVGEDADAPAAAAGGEGEALYLVK